MNNMNYEECLSYMYSQLPMYHRVGQAAYKTDLTNTLLLCQHFGNPHNDVKCIHIAGTNGKTSTSHFVASILEKAGYKVGLYTSPHLADFRERIMINGEMISKEFVMDFVLNNKQVFAQIQPSFFEMTVAMAFLYFKQEKVDFAVIEVGMGGRLDSTNVITPLVSAITNIGYDHTQFLGDTLQLIAGEKAGIIKAGVPVVIGETQEETKDVFVAKAEEMNAPIFFADQIFDISELHQDFSSLRFTATSKLTTEVYHVDSALVGHYEVKNIKTVLAVMEELSKVVDISKDAIEAGLGESKLRGRWDIIYRAPLTVCDTGHNSEGLAANLEMLGFGTFDKLHIVFGAVSDKDVSKTAKMMPKDAVYYFCKPNIPRGMDADLLKEKFAEVGISGVVYASCMEALRAARGAAGAKDLIYVGGSTFVVADTLTELNK